MKRVLVAVFLWQVAVLAIDEKRVSKLMLLEPAVLEGMCFDFARVVQLSSDIMEATLKTMRKMPDYKLQLARNVSQYEEEIDQMRRVGKLPWQKDPEATDS